MHNNIVEKWTNYIERFSFSMSKESKIWISKINIETKISDNSSLISGWGDFLRTDL